MNKLMKLVSMLVVALLALSLFSGCATKKEAVKDAADSTAKTEEKADNTKEAVEKVAEAEPITLTVWAQYGDEANVAFIDTAFEELKEKYPNVELELVEYVADSGATLRTRAATGDLPDIVFVTNAEIQFLSESENIIKLNDAADAMDFDQYLLPSTRQIMYQPDGSAYAFPMGGNYVGFLYYNKALFAEQGLEVPTNYEEFKAVVKALRANDIIPVSTFSKEKWPNAVLLDMFIVQDDAKGIKGIDDGTARFSDPAYKTAITKLNELVEMGMLADGATNLGYDQAVALFNEGKAAMFVNGSWELLGSTMPEDQIDWMLYPFNDKAPLYRFAGGAAPAGFAVSSHTEHTDIAAEIAAELSKINARVSYEVMGNPVIALKVDPSWATPKLHPGWVKWLETQELAESVTYFSSAMTNQEARAEFDKTSQMLMVPGMDVEDIIKTADAELDRIFK